VNESHPGGGLAQAAEVAVVALAVGGDESAFVELVRRRQSWLRNLLRRLCRDPILADDLAQQVFLRAWQSLRGLRSAAAFGGWLRQLALNTWLQYRRTAPPDPVDLPEELPVSAASWERLDLDRALAKLPRDERMCIVLAYSEGMSHGEISAATALPLGTVKSHIRRGAERLRSLLSDYASPGFQSHV
jgi:RNA polymerase sigma factor (sigma-70 family)